SMKVKFTPPGEVWPLTVAVTDTVPDPAEGAVTVSVVAVAAVTVAVVLPKRTMLLATVVSKPVPVSVTVWLGRPEVGLIAVTVGSTATLLLLT
ncbi:hypothetical protein ABI111_15140, partial [Enterococcus faecium]